MSFNLFKSKSAPELLIFSVVNANSSMSIVEFISYFFDDMFKIEDEMPAAIDEKNFHRNYKNHRKTPQFFPELRGNSGGISGKL